MGNKDDRDEGETKRLSDVVLRRMLSTPAAVVASKKRKAPKKAKRVK